MESMRFCIAKVKFWQAVGFDTEYWRTSVDGVKAMCHDKFASTLVDIENNPNVATYSIDSEEFNQIILDEFTEPVVEEPIEEGIEEGGE